MHRLLVAAVLLLAAACSSDTSSRALAPTTGVTSTLSSSADASTTSVIGLSAPSVEEDAEIVLRHDGLGAVPLGVPVDEALAELERRWGPPDADVLWEHEGGSPFGVCPAPGRGVTWRHFSVLFSTAIYTNTGPADGRTADLRFFAWVYTAGRYDLPVTADAGGRRPRLATEKGASIASTVADLRRLYGADLGLSPDDDPAAGGPHWWIAPQGWPRGLGGSVTTIRPEGRVRSMTGGAPCGE